MVPQLSWSPSHRKKSKGEMLMNLAHKLSLTYVPVQEMERELLWEFTILFPNVPGKTTIVVHNVDMGNIPPIKVHPYRMNQVSKAKRNKIGYMHKME